MLLQRNQSKPPPIERLVCEAHVLNGKPFHSCIITCNAPENPHNAKILFGVVPVTPINPTKILAFLPVRWFPVQEVEYQVGRGSSDELDNDK